MNPRDTTGYPRPKAHNVYEGSDTDSDDAVTSGRVTTQHFSKTDYTSETIRTAISKVGEQSMTYKLQVGQLAPEGEHFCLFKSVASYPYMYVGKGNKDRVSKEFFAQGRVYEHGWDLFYIYRGPPEHDRPLFLVPTEQFVALLSKINRQFDTKLTIPCGAKGIFQAFFPNAAPRPRYLGRFISKDVADKLKQNTPPLDFRPSGESGTLPRPTQAASIAFWKQMDMLVQAQQARKVAHKEKKEAAKVETRKQWNESIKRIQGYLGLKMVEQSPTDSLELGDSAYIATSVDLEQPVSFEQFQSVVFVCVDVEAYERNTRQITEIGVATLDTRDITFVAPGQGGKNWMPAIRARHFRILEHKHLNNTDFVSGCADNFEFGESEFIRLKDAPHTVSTCFKYPFSKLGTESNGMEAKRNIVLVGHDIGSDIKFLEGIGYDVGNLSNLLETADTATMWKYLKRETNMRRLGSILAELGIDGWWLHNAGNDAMYTLQAMIGIAMKDFIETKERQEGREAHTPHTLVDAKDGVNSAGDDSDGGVVA